MEYSTSYYYYYYYVTSQYLISQKINTEQDERSDGRTTKNTIINNNKL